MGDKIRETSLRFEHVKMKVKAVPMRKSYSMQVDGQRRGMDRMKRTLMKATTLDLKKYNLFEDLAHDRSEWRMPDPI